MYINIKQNLDGLSFKIKSKNVSVTSSLSQNY